MRQPTQFQTTTPPVKDSLNPSQRHRGFVLIALALAYFALLPTMQSRPMPDGDFGNANTAEGRGALFSLTTGHDNTATGFNTLFSNTSGVDNTATGSSALIRNTTGHDNTATGIDTLFSNSTGANNTADGDFALSGNSTGNFNIGLGFNAGSLLTTGDNNIDIGNEGNAGEANTIRIGTTGNQTATFVAGISGTAVVGDTVVVDANGQLGTLVSSERFKNDIKPMDKASEAIFALKPVTFRYKHKLDPQDIPQFGLVAEEVEKVNPALVARDAQGKVYTVRYEAVNAMLLNEFLKQHRRVQELEATLARQKKEMEVMTTSLKDQARQVQKISDRLELSRPAPRVVDN